MGHRLRVNPLLNIPIGRRLALGFLLPGLIAALALGSIGVQSQQRLLEESTFYQHNLDAYTSLTDAASILQQMHTHTADSVAYASQPNPSPAILQDDQTLIQGLALQFQAIFALYSQKDLIAPYADLVALFTEAGHGAQIALQSTYTENARASWKTYRSLQDQVLQSIHVGNLANAQTLMATQVDAAFTDALRDLQSLIKFNESLVPSLHDAANVEAQKLLISIVIVALGGVFGIGLVGWLVSTTLVRRLKRLRVVAQAIANGQVDMRLDTRGHDEITDVSVATNSMLDTLVGLLEETQRQRDELASAQQLQQLHAQLQQEHEALNQANTRLAALATSDPLTELPNHRAVINRIDEELACMRQTHRPCALLFLDIDHFKRINDTWGHQVGDAILCQFSRRVKQHLRSADFVGRYGGEEFVVVLPDTNLYEAKLMAERLRKAVAEQPCSCEIEENGRPTERPISVTASIGGALSFGQGMAREGLIEAADQAMYQAKHMGRNRVCFAQEEAASAQLPDTAVA